MELPSDLWNLCTSEIEDISINSHEKDIVQIPFQVPFRSRLPFDAVEMVRVEMRLTQV
jgi:hypothetical protein